MTGRGGDRPKISLTSADVDGSLAQRVTAPYNADGSAKAMVRFVLGRVPARAPGAA